MTQLGALLGLLILGATDAGLPTLDPGECLIQPDVLPTGTPRFQEYPVRTVHISRPAAVSVRGNPAAQAFRSRLRWGAVDGPNFAGHYTLVAWGCGACCIDWGVVDAVDGKVTFAPDLRGVSCDHVDNPDTELDDFDGVDRTTLQLRFRRDSNLLVVLGRPNEDPTRDGAGFYVWDGHAFQSVGFVPRTAFCSIKPPPSPPERAQYKGRYLNKDHGFSVQVPSGYVGEESLKNKFSVSRVVEIMSELESIRYKYNALQAGMSETVRRRWAASEALALGRGGMTLVARATGLSAPTIRRGIRELKTGTPLSEERVRRPGAGRKKVTAKDETLLRDLEALVAPSTRGDPMSPLQWTCKSAKRLGEELQRQGHSVSTPTVWSLLNSLGYSLQSNRKVREGRAHPDRDAQFEYINARVQDFQRKGQPVISVDTKKKELVGNFKNAGREWRPKGEFERVRVHDFMDEDLGKAIPYGVYDVTANADWVSVGVDHDTPDFAVESIRQWWKRMGKPLYPHARELLITADGGGSNGVRSRLWKIALQRLADEAQLDISVSHFPPGTSKWNKIEHRMFSHITQNWRGKPLVSLHVIVSLIASTTTQTGLKIRARVDRHDYPTGIGVTRDELSKIRLRHESFHGEWNYQILPTQAR